MKCVQSFTVLLILITSPVFYVSAQHRQMADTERKLYKLVELYSQARENQDTVLLKSILTPDIDQLVSTGEWRNGLSSAIKGMLRSTAASAGNRTITIDKIKYIGTDSAIIDTRYDVPNADGSVRKMWSCFIAVKYRDDWKISAIRNMMPAGPN
jgi:hypothetical protein